MFHRQSVCGLILGLTLVILAGVFRPGESAAPPQPARETADHPPVAEVADITPPVPAEGAPRDLADENSAPGTSTSRSGGDAPGTLP